MSTVEARILRRETDMVHAELRRQILQLAIAIHHADRTNVVAFGKQQFDDEFALRPKRRRLRCAPPCLRRLW